MFDRFTDRARRIMGLATGAARRLNHEFIGTEHILLGLVEEGSGGAVNVLKRSGIDLARIQGEVLKVAKARPTPPQPGNLPFTPRAKRVLELAVAEATALGHDFVGSEHLLLGLIGENEGLAARVLSGLGLTLESARTGVRESVAGDAADRDPILGAKASADWSEEQKLKVDFHDFTDGARKVMELAKAEARRLDHECVGTQHILVGLIEEGNGVAADVFRRLNVDLRRVRESLEKIVLRSQGPIRSPGLPFTPRGKALLESAAREASQRGHSRVGTEHLLLGLLKENEGVAARVLLHLGVKFETVGAKVAEVLGDGSARPAAVARTEASPRSDTLSRLALGGTKVAAADTIVIPPLAPAPSSLRIGVVGAGGIVRNAHLPAYRKWKLGTTAIVDVRREAAASAAKEFDIATVCSSVEELVRRPDVDVVDVAIPEQARAAVLPVLLKAGKPVLLQKPLAYSLADARRIVDDFARAKVPLAVNQNLRWSPEMQAAKHLIANGHLGQLFDLRWTMRNTSDRRMWAKGSWYSKDERFQVLSWSEHHLDAFRFLLDDEGARVYCALPRRPDQNFTGDVAATAVIHFRNGAHVSMVDSNVSTPGRPEEQTLDVDGTGGSLTFGLAKPRYFAYWLAKEIVGEGDAPAHVPALDGEWYPDGFAGSMATFLRHLRDGTEAPISGRRNLGTMALVDACYRSAASGAAVEVTRVAD